MSRASGSRSSSLFASSVHARYMYRSHHSGVAPPIIRVHQGRIGRMAAMTRSRRAVPALAMSTLIVLAGCTSSHSVPGSSGTLPQSSAALPAVNPLTGEQPSNNPVIAVKIEDTALGRPQVGIDKADIVFVEQVE